jgi:hypothetical protein
MAAAVQLIQVLESHLREKTPKPRMLDVTDELKRAAEEKRRNPEPPLEYPKFSAEILRKCAAITSAHNLKEIFRSKRYVQACIFTVITKELFKSGTIGRQSHDSRLEEAAEGRALFRARNLDRDVDLQNGKIKPGSSPGDRNPWQHAYVDDSYYRLSFVVDFVAAFSPEFLVMIRGVQDGLTKHNAKCLAERTGSIGKLKKTGAFSPNYYADWNDTWVIMNLLHHRLFPDFPVDAAVNMWRDSDVRDIYWLLSQPAQVEESGKPGRKAKFPEAVDNFLSRNPTIRLESNSANAPTREQWAAAIAERAGKLSPESVLRRGLQGRWSFDAPHRVGPPAGWEATPVRLSESD